VRKCYIFRALPFCPSASALIANQKDQGSYWTKVFRQPTPGRVLNFLALSPPTTRQHLSFREPHVDKISLTQNIMDISNDLDSDNVSLAPATGVIPATGLCICQPLHRNCNPSTCRRALNVDNARRKDDVGKLTESPSSKKRFTHVTCNRGDLRDAALGGCTTCAILYGGAGPKDAPAVGNNPWPSVMVDENVMVQIRVVGGLVRCKIWPAVQTTRGYKLPINLAFYASDRSCTHILPTLQIYSPFTFI